MKTKITLICLLYLFLGSHTQSLAQSILNISPKSANIGKTLDVTLTASGSHFVQGSTSVDFGEGILVQQVRALNQVTLLITLNISSGANIGFRNVKVTTGSEIIESPSGFEIFASSGNFRSSLDLLPLESVSLSDLDPNNPQSAPILFFVNLFNDAQDRIIRIDVSLFSSKGFLGKIYLRNYSIAANATKRLSSREFNRFELNGSLGNDFLNEVKQRGTFPPDAYVYKLEILDESNQIISTDENNTVLTNPKYNPELISPGGNFSLPVEKVVTANPLFQWFGQTNKFDFYLYKVLPNQTAEEAARNIPVFQLTDINTNSLLYPIYAEKLVDQTMYAWQIKGKMSSSKGTVYLPSEVFRFFYESNTQKGGGTGGGSQGNVLVSKIILLPGSATLTPGQTMQFNAILLNSDNQTITDVKPVWSITPNNIGTIAQNGLYTAGNIESTVAVLVKAGNVTEFVTLDIKPIETKKDATFEYKDWVMDQMARKLFGLPKQ